MYAACFLCDVDPNSTMLQSFVLSLKMATAETTWYQTLQEGDSRQDQLWFWTLCVGGIVTLDSATSDWFANQAPPFCESLQLSGWNEATAVLCKVSWSGEKLTFSV